MPDSAYPKTVSEVIATLAEIFRHQGNRQILELLESAHARFDETGYDNWDGGIYYWALRLEVPVPIFAAFEPRLPDIEKELYGRLNYLNRMFKGDRILEVTIAPITSGASGLGERMAPSELEVQHLWPDGRFRLFLSHLAKYRVAVSKLKDELAGRGVAAFVAHEDIEPSLEWQGEIELGLCSMHALAALITPDFHASPWTDQEIGWALGRGVLVLPVLLGADPYGLAGKYQGVRGALHRPANLATSIIKALLANSQTHSEMRRSLVKAFSCASSTEIAIELSWIVIKITDFTEEEKAILRKACTENNQVIENEFVPEAIYSAIGEPPSPKPAPADDIPF